MLTASALNGPWVIYRDTTITTHLNSRCREVLMRRFPKLGNFEKFVGIKWPTKRKIGERKSAILS